MPTRLERAEEIVRFYERHAKAGGSARASSSAS
jgi:hypothetical protein